MSDVALSSAALSPRRFTSIWWLELVFRIMLGGYFVWFALLKLPDPNLFALDIRNYKILPDPLNSALALGLIWLELFAGLGLIFRRLYLGSLIAINGMLCVFILAICSALLRGLDISCGCSGQGVSSGLIFRLVIDLIALAVGVILLAWNSRSFPPADVAE